MNVFDIVIIAAVAVALFFAVRSMVRRKGSGCSCCSGCSGCPHAGKCDKKV